MAKLWNSCTMESFFGHEVALETAPCRVRIGDGHVEVFYDDDSGEVCYRGPEIGAGHYNVTREHHGAGSLHHFPDGRILEGWWREDGEVGMWRITLGD